MVLSVKVMKKASAQRVVSKYEMLLRKNKMMYRYIEYPISMVICCREKKTSVYS